MNRLLLAIALLLVIGCNCGPKPIIEKPDGGTGGGSGGGSGSVIDSGCDARCLSTTLGFERNGGFVSYTDRYTLSCFSLSVQRSFDGGQCSLPVYCAPVSIQRIDALLVHPVIVNAFSARTLFGHDSRPADGQVLRIFDASGAFFEVGFCDATAPCPPEIVELHDLLQAIVSQAPCSI